MDSNHDTKRDIQLLGCFLRLHALTALLALVEAGAVLNVLQVPQPLQTQIALPLPLEIIGAAFWSGLFLLATIVLLYYGRAARRFAVTALIAFVCYNLIRWIAFTKADYDRERLPALIIASMIVIFILVASWIGLRRGASTEKVNDPEPEN